MKVPKRIFTGFIAYHRPQLTAAKPTNPFRSSTMSSEKEQRAHDPKAADQMLDSEKHVGRNPHPDFKSVETSRPDWTEDDKWVFTKTRKPDWKLGDGPNDGGECLKKAHVEIDPYAEGRPAVSNYKLLISGIIPRPVGFCSTRSKDGKPASLLTPSILSKSSPFADPRPAQLTAAHDDLRPQHQPRPLLLLPSRKPRSPDLHRRLRRRLRQGQGLPAQPHRIRRVHAQHHLRTLHRSRE